jgi:hypothetical protein
MRHGEQLKHNSECNCSQALAVSINIILGAQRGTAGAEHTRAPPADAWNSHSQSGQCFRWVQTALPSGCGSCCPPCSWHALLQAVLILEIWSDDVEINLAS